MNEAVKVSAIGNSLGVTLPREVPRRHRIAEGVQHGQINRWQAMRDERHDARVERQLVRDEAMHDGHITLGEQYRMNRELDRNSVRIEDQRQERLLEAVRRDGGAGADAGCQGKG